MSRDPNKVYLQAVDSPYRGQGFVHALEDSGFTVVDNLSQAAWAITSFAGELPKLVGKVPRVLAATMEVRPLMGQPRVQVIDGTEITSLHMGLGDYPDIWKFFIGPGETEPEFLPWPRKEEKLVCVLARNVAMPAPDDLFSVRRRLVEECYAAGVLDVFGTGWRGIQTVGEHRMGQNGKNWVQIKHEIIRNYRFNVALENTYIPNYVTEKFWQAVQAGCVPVYYGSSWMDRLVPSDTYLDLRELASPQQVQEAMAKVTPAQAEDMVGRAVERMAQLRKEHKQDIYMLSRHWHQQACDRLRAANDLELMFTGGWAAENPSPQTPSQKAAPLEPTPQEVSSPTTPTVDGTEFRQTLRRVEAAGARRGWTMPQEIEAQSFLHQLLEPQRLLPPAGGWAANYSTLAAVLDHLTTVERPLIYDFGGGVSTLYFALFVQKYGGQVVSIDSESNYLEITRSYLKAFGVERCAALVHAPIAEVDGELWYDRASIPRIPGVDLVFVDGPLGALQKGIRRHALPFMIDLISDDCLVAVDDTIRPDEHQMAEQWMTEYSGIPHHINGVGSIIFHVARPDSAPQLDTKVASTAAPAQPA